MFVATDGSDDEVALLMKEVPNLSVMRGANSDFGHPGSDDAPRSAIASAWRCQCLLLATGVNAVVEQWVTIIADTFVGTQVRMHETRAPTQTLPKLTEIVP